MKVALYTKVTWIFLIVLLASCNTPRQGLLSKKTPHERYQSGLQSAGLHHTALGKSWERAATLSVQKPVQISLPFQETGHFEMSSPNAAGYVFSAKKGERLSVSLETNPGSGILIFTDLWSTANNKKNLLMSGDTITHAIEYNVTETGEYILRLQPELLQGISYTIAITTGPTLAFPVQELYNPKVLSVWGDGRDGNARKHEGIDIFAKKGTPVVAIADGYITSVKEGGIGGKVVFMQPSGSSLNLYYAHLDSQLVQAGALVKAGTVVGLMGNTGNAKNTPAHLHFGIYTRGGAVDPLPFVNNKITPPKKITADTTLLFTSIARMKSSAPIYTSTTSMGKEQVKLNTGQLVKILSATADFYKVQLPDSSIGFVKSNVVTTNTLRKIKIAAPAKILDRPSASGLIKRIIKKEAAVNVMGTSGEFSYVTTDSTNGWIVL